VSHDGTCSKSCATYVNMELLVIRHLPTKYNNRGILQGHLDVDIEPPNSKQMLRITENQRKIRQVGSVDRVLCSSFNRTAQTALAYGYDEKVCIREPLLNELNFGCYEGRPKQEMLNALGEAWRQSPECLILGEPVLALQHRIIRFLEKYAQVERLLLFSHGAWARALISYSQTGDIRDMNQVIVNNNDMLCLALA